MADKKRKVSANRQERSKKNRRSGPEKHTGKNDKPQALNREHENLLRWFGTVKFRKTLIGGVDEVQLWKKLEELDRLYDAAVRAERTRYDALILDHMKSFNALLGKYKRELAARDRAAAKRQDFERENGGQR